jgi:Tfp pilus assembly protein PilW
MVRLQQLQAHYEKAADDGNVRLALDVLEKAAKEAGGAHSNERTVNLTGRLAVEHKDVTEDDMRSGVAAAIAQALEAERAKVGNVTKH